MGLRAGLVESGYDGIRLWTLVLPRMRYLLLHWLCNMAAVEMGQTGHVVPESLQSDIDEMEFQRAEMGLAITVRLTSLINQFSGAMDLSPCERHCPKQNMSMLRSH
jgi:hypothetical protein